MIPGVPVTFSGLRRSTIAWLADRFVVVPDGCGQREDARQHAGGDALGGTPAILFQFKLAFQRSVRRFDDLAQPLEELLVGAACPALADRAKQRSVTLGEVVLEGAAEVVLVPDQRLPWAGVHDIGSVPIMPSRTSRSAGRSWNGSGRSAAFGTSPVVSTKLPWSPAVG